MAARYQQIREFGLGRLLTIVAVVVLAAALLWFVSAVTFANVYRTGRPQLALTWAPFDPGAMANQAYRLLEEQNPVAVPRARALAKAALDRDPTNVAAVRTLGLVASINRDPQAAARLFRYSEALSRRDLVTQLWLIQANVERDDVGGALHHFDAALRTSHTRGSLLYPILIRASAETAIATSLNQLLLTKPGWWRTFVTQLIVETQAPAMLPAVTRGLLDPKEEEDRELIVSLIDRLLRDKEYGPALAVYRDAVGATANPPLVRNGGFESEDRYPPLEWQFPQNSGVSAQRRLAPAGDDFRLNLIAGSARAEAARQLLLLAPGRYRLSARIGDVGNEEALRPTLSLACLIANQGPVARLDFPTAGAEGADIGTTITIPGGCPAQWLAIEAGGGAGSGDAGWIDAISIERLSGI